AASAVRRRGGADAATLPGGLLLHLRTVRIDLDRCGDEWRCPPGRGAGAGAMGAGGARLRGRAGAILSRAHPAAWGLLHGVDQLAAWRRGATGWWPRCGSGGAAA